MEVLTRSKRIVVGIDGSDESRSALDWAIRAAEPRGTIHAVHAIAPAVELAVAAAQVDSAPMVKHRANDLDRWTAATDVPGVEIVRTLVEDHAADALLRLSAEVEADLVVVGVHARSRFTPRTLGRVTTKLVHDIDRPLVVVRPGPDRPLDEGSVVVAGVGHGAATRAALVWAAEFASSNGTALSLIHAVSRRPVFGEDGVLDVVAFYVDRTLLHDWALDELAAVADELQRATEQEVPISWSAPDGSPGPVLVDAGADATLLVIGRHHDGDRASRSIAPDLHHVLTHSPCPVVVVPVVEPIG